MPIEQLDSRERTSAAAIGYGLPPASSQRGAGAHRKSAILLTAAAGLARQGSVVRCAARARRVAPQGVDRFWLAGLRRRLHRWRWVRAHLLLVARADVEHVADLVPSPHLARGKAVMAECFGRRGQQGKPPPCVDRLLRMGRGFAPACSPLACSSQRRVAAGVTVAAPAKRRSRGCRLRPQPAGAAHPGSPAQVWRYAIATIARSIRPPSMG